MAGEVIAGLLAHSLALLSDAAHMLTDAGSLGLAVFAARLARRPAGGALTYGLKRTEILSALLNGVTLTALAIVIVVEAALRLATPANVTGTALIVVACAGAVVSLGAARLVAGANRRNLNVEAALRHVLTDLFAFAGTALAGVLIVTTGFARADAVASMLIAALMIAASLDLIRSATRTLLEAAPLGIDPAEVGTALAKHPHVASLHDLHIWEVSSGFAALSAHVLVHPGDDCHAIRIDLERLLAQAYGIEHTTLQVDHANDGTVHWVTDARGAATEQRK